MTFEDNIRARLSSVANWGAQGSNQDNASQPKPAEDNRNIVLDYSSKPADKTVTPEPTKEPVTPTPAPADKDPNKTEEEQAPAFDKTELDKFVPKSRFNDVYWKMKEFERKNAQLQKIVDERLAKMTDEDKEYLKDLRKTGVVSPEETIMAQNHMEMQSLNEELARSVEQDVKYMETNFKWDNWFPKFDKEVVIQYWLDKQIYNPIAAYRDMYFADIVDYYVNETLKKQKSQPKFSSWWSEAKQPVLAPDKPFWIGTDSWQKSLKDHLVSKLKAISGK